ncbi:LysR family transcriptional regulator [Ferrimonas sp. YFM]|uniref:LysR family transcriptional regulator n=1 Tax=Ferrimonas sp. YFM TaxID=3028878 RepID=UPI0025737D6C|nr:LysR family transcriptional regulator [Ferrimonas sp. YFM]BDY05586.1 LysR family transcriptional regulator [Ferrimonas sp. YFM]
MNTTIRSLNCFLALVKCGNYTKAADQLFMTQPTLSKMIQRLEESLGTPLLVRSNQGIRLTPAGEHLKQTSESIVGQWHRLQQELGSLTDLTSGTLRLGICPMLSSLMIELLSQFRQRYPGVVLKMSEYGGYGCEQALIADKLDIAFTALPVTHSEQLDYKQLAQYPLWVCLPHSHPLTEKTSIQWQDFHNESFVLYNEDFSLAQLISRLSQQNGVKLKVAFRSGQWDFLATMVENGMGLALLPAPICQKLNSAKLTFRPMEPALHWDLALIWRKSLPLTPAADALLTLSRNFAPGDLALEEYNI